MTSRQEQSERLVEPLDLLVIGGGITGAGILLEAARRGWRAALVEQRDFAWGTSSRSSKLVHGGLRYLREGRLRLIRDAVRSREALCRETAGLVQAQAFALGDYAGSRPPRWQFALGLMVYDALAGCRGRAGYSAEEFLMRVPRARRDALRGGIGYIDARTDDARLVLRVLQAAQQAGAVALNYCRCLGLLKTQGRVAGARLRDELTGAQFEAQARVVVNATGAWADELRQGIGERARLRPLRGSHLVLPAWRLPVAVAVALMHPWDGRPVFMFPWEGTTLVGTTDVDHREDLSREARITPEESAYLLAAVRHQFPDLGITLDDVTSTYAGVRPVVNGGRAEPSSEGRDHAVWTEHGMVTVTGGKLTTFRLIALDALRAAERVLGRSPGASPAAPLFAAARWPDGLPAIPEHLRLRLIARYGQAAAQVVQFADMADLEEIPGTGIAWAELRWAARAEQVEHLEDLLLRRVRLGLVAAQGGMPHLPRIRALCQRELGWDDARWEREASAYRELWEACYSTAPCR